MQRVCFLLKLKEDRIDDYLKAHQVWPELIDEMKKVGIQNYSMFLRQDGLVVGYLEAPDCKEALRQLEKTDVSQRWEASVAEYFEGAGGDSENLDWLEQYFYMP